MHKYTTVAEFMTALPASQREQVELVRSLILSLPNLEEHIKWNAPSYVSGGVDRITFNLMNKYGLVRLVLHMGTARVEHKQLPAVMSDEFDLIEWSSDIRGSLTFSDLADIQAKQDEIVILLKQWLQVTV